MIMNQDELGLSDEQTKKIKDLSLKTEKNLISSDAEIDTIAADIKAEMWTDSIDTASIGKLVDKKYDLKKEKVKSLITAYATLKGMLTEEQKGKLKELYKKCEMTSPKSSMMMRGKR